MVVVSSVLGFILFFSLQCFNIIYKPTSSLSIEHGCPVSLQHAYRDGRLEEVVLRHLGNEDGQTVIAKHIRSYALLCKFLFLFFPFLQLEYHNW